MEQPFTNRPTADAGIPVKYEDAFPRQRYLRALAEGHEERAAELRREADQLDCVEVRVRISRAKYLDIAQRTTNNLFKGSGFYADEAVQVTLYDDEGLIAELKAAR